MILLDHRFGSNSDNGETGPTCDSGGGRPRITVIYTNIEGTLAALNAAVNLSKGLEAKIVLLVAAELGIYYPLDHPPVAASFFEKVSGAILEEMRLEEFAVRREIHFCRRQVECLEARLAPRSLVVLGTNNRRWQLRERRLAHTLKLLGHDALLVRPSAETSHSWSVVQRLVNENPESKLA
jgi:hypothetical protein